MFTKIIGDGTKECLIINQIEAQKQGLQDMEVEFGYDGKMYLKGYAPQKPLEELKEEKIIVLKDNAYNLIIKKYPLYKQLNIIRLGPAEDLTQMSKYIDDIRIKVDSIEKQINLSSTEEQLDKININFIEE